MPLLGPAAMLLTFDIAAEAIAEHDDWHTHEHLPERLSIPGFLRGTRWVAAESSPRYLVLYEVAELETLASPAYLERLNQPSPWTQRMMPHYRGMRRGLCAVACSRGLGVGQFALLVRFNAAPPAQASLEQWLCTGLLPQLPARPGLGSAHLLRSALTPAMTSEQRIRGTDAGMGWALLATGYQPQALVDLERAELHPDALETRGASDICVTTYQAAYSLSRQEIEP